MTRLKQRSLSIDGVRRFFWPGTLCDHLFANIQSTFQRDSSSLTPLLSFLTNLEQESCKKAPKPKAKTLPLSDNETLFKLCFKKRFIKSFLERNDIWIRLLISVSAEEISTHLNLVLFFTGGFLDVYKQVFPETARGVCVTSGKKCRGDKKIMVLP